jgi:RNA-directed DNA polymerase
MQHAARVGHERRSTAEPSPFWWSASCAINVLLLKSKIKYRVPCSPSRHCPLKLKVCFCVRGVVSPILANLFLHYAFDVWMRRTHSDLPWCRYADDGLVHCRTEQEAEVLKAELQARLAECHLEMHPMKTKVVYCKDGKRKGKYPNVKFDFLGYCFRPRRVRRLRDNSLFGGFNPAVSSSAMKAMRQAIRDLNLRRQPQLTLQDIAQQAQSSPSGVDCVLRALCPLGAVSTCCVTSIRRSWRGRCVSSSASNDYKVPASQFLQRLATEYVPDLFVHWRDRDDWRVCLMGAE